MIRILFFHQWVETPLQRDEWDIWRLGLWIDQLADACLRGLPEALGSIPVSHELSVAVQAWNLLTWEVGAGGSQVQGHAQTVNLGPDPVSTSKEVNK